MIDKNQKSRWLAYAALVASSVMAWRTAAALVERRRLLRQGEIGELHSEWFNVNDCRVHVRVSAAAAGPASVPVVFVHGWGASGSYFLPTAERLAANYAVYAPDLPGHGLSDTPSRPLDVAGLAQSLLDWMSRAGIARASLVGHSMGCQVAVEAAIRNPDRIDRLVLIGPTPDPASRPTLEMVRRFLIGGAFERPSINRHLMKDYSRMGRRLIPEFRFMVQDPIEDKLAKLTQPVMLVRGEKDPIAPQRWLEEAARLAHTDRKVVIGGWGHAVQYDTPLQLAEAIRPFLDQAK